MCRRNPSMRPNAGAPAVFWLMISVSLGHLVLSNILTMSHMLRQKRHIHSQWCMWMQKQTEVHPANMATSVQKDAQTEKKMFLMFQQLMHSGNAPRYSLLLMSESTTRSDGWTSCSLYCLKSSSSPPAVALSFHARGRLWWLMQSLLGSFGGKKGSFCWSHSLILQWYEIFTVEQCWKITASELKIETVSHSSMRALQCHSRWIKLMPVCSEHRAAVFQPQLSTWTRLYHSNSLRPG